MIVHQLLTSLVPGDAISNEALTIRRILLEEGHESRIFGYYHHASLAFGQLLHRPQQRQQHQGE